MSMLLWLAPDLWTGCKVYDGYSLRVGSAIYVYWHASVRYNFIERAFVLPLSREQWPAAELDLTPLWNSPKGRPLIYIWSLFSFASMVDMMLHVQQDLPAMAIM